MLSFRQKKGALTGIIWGLLSWVPYYTNHLNSIRGVFGIPAGLGLNLELALNKGDAFIYSILLGTGLGFVIGSLFDFVSKGIKIIIFFPPKKKFLKRGI